MSDQHSVNIPAHHNIYTGSSQRALRIEFCIPEKGVNENTGLVVFVPGFGGNIDSKVYKKMRSVFADQYNLVTVQCDYFGSKFMQSANNFRVKDPHQLQEIFSNEEMNRISSLGGSAFIEILSEKNTNLSVVANLDETSEEFNDMSYMQALDIITALEVIKTILRENNLKFNTKRTIGYGHSHGAYLLHLSNRLAPELFSFIIDNSAWVEPAYLFSNRALYQKIGKATLVTDFDYLAKKVIRNKNDLNLRNLYRHFNNTAQILSFQGDNDNLVNHIDKRTIIELLDHSNFIIVTENDVDHIKYKSNRHGLDADFLELFSFALEFEKQRETPKVSFSEDYELKFDGVDINVDTKHGLPLFRFNF